MTDAGRPFGADHGGVRLAVRLTPRAGRNSLDGIAQDADGLPVLRVRLAAPPVEGAANKALIGFLAAALGLRHSDIGIRSGHAGRLKILHLAGDPAAILARLEAWVAPTCPDPR